MTRISTPLPAIWFRCSRVRSADFPTWNLRKECPEAVVARMGGASAPPFGSCVENTIQSKLVNIALAG